MSHWKAIGALAALALLLASGRTDAQERPTLERLEQSACVAADADGHGYRPVFCDARCDCLASAPPVALAAIDNCEQQPAGEITARVEDYLDSAACLGTCAITNLPCQDDSNCAGGAGVCKFAGTFVPPACTMLFVPCVFDAQCDQSKGYSCQLVEYFVPGGKLCQKAPGSCAAAGVCDTDVQVFGLTAEFDFAPSGLAALRCEAAWGASLYFSGKVSSTDLATCITALEGVLGAGACVICGDGNLDAGEQCDDGNLSAGDGCAPDCTTE